MLDRKIFLDLSKVTNARVGRKQMDQENNPEVVLGGIGIQSMHANFVTDDSKTQLKSMDKAACNLIWVNGEKITNMDAVTLKPNDRIVFGTGSAFLFRNQLKDSESGPVTDDPPITYEFAMNEKMQNEEKEEMARKEIEKQRAEEEAAKKMKEMEDKLAAERAEQEAAQAKL